MITIRELEARTDVRGSAFNVTLPFDRMQECHVATLRPGHVRGNHYHREGRELLLIVHTDRWSLHWDSGEGTPVESRTFRGAGVEQIEVEPPAAHAIRNDGRSDLQLFVLGDASRARSDHDTFPRRIAEPLLRIAGIDGCPGGWIAVVKDQDAIHARICRSDDELRALFEETLVSAIDIPIGLADRGPRACDHHARRFLGRRGSSVFPAPIRPLVSLPWKEANEVSRSIQQNKGVSRQAAAIYPKVHQVDQILQRDAALRERVFEVHPEVSFAMWNAGRPLEASKHTPEGKALRRALVIEHFGEAALEEAMHVARGHASTDDVLDAFAALWSAERIVSRRAGMLGDGHTDATGLPMRIAY